MITGPPDFGEGAYTERYGSASFLGTLLALLGWSALTAVVLAVARVSVGRDVVLGVVEAGLLLACGNELAKVTRHEIAFAAYSRGVYFGDGLIKDDVPWSQICAVEFFTERVSGTRSQSRYRCVGVRAPGHEQIPRPGNGPAAQPTGTRGAQFMIDAGRADLIPGADGTVRYAYRRMRGWRVDRVSLTHAVARFAPGIPVINGPDYPPTLTTAQALAAKRQRRARSGR